MLFKVRSKQGGQGPHYLMYHKALIDRFFERINELSIEIVAEISQRVDVGAFT